jgi:MinD superfamily P-loop ATPase
MIIAVASGKGGTGKTTISANLALCLREPVSLLDCDVEEPNCHLFLNPEIHRRERVNLPFPVVDETLCNGCGECSRMCQYNAIVALKTKPLVFPALCHGCGGCAKVCPVNAISEGIREIGTIETGTGRHVRFVQGRLDVGQSMSPPLIRAVRRQSSTEGITIVDCPPGTSCPVIAAVRHSNYVLLVTEPSPFGLHDLKLAVETIRRLDLNFGVVINRAISSDRRVVKYCESEHIPVLLQIPDNRRAAVAYSRGQLLVETVPELREYFERLALRVLSEVERKKRGEKAGRSNLAGIA